MTDPHAHTRHEFLCLVRSLLPSSAPERIEAAARAAEALPDPPDEFDETTPYVIYDTALHLELTGDWARCSRLYLKMLAYRFSDKTLAGSAWFRHGVCQESLGALREAVQAYRRALPLSESYAVHRALVRWRLANLLFAAEEHEEALALATELATLPCPPELPPLDVMKLCARCLNALGRCTQARALVSSVLSGPEPAALDLLALAAQLSENAGATGEALAHYQEILCSPSASPKLREAVLERVRALRDSPSRTTLRWPVPRRRPARVPVPETGTAWPAGREA
jgi:tetratricopeptide (TPR) repeat protein